MKAHTALKRCIFATIFFAATFAVAAQPVCKIGATNYATLDDALNAVPTGGTTQTVIKLLNNIDYTNTEGFYLIDNKKITFDLNDYDLVFNVRLLVFNTSVVDYTGKGHFKVMNFLGLQSQSFCKLTYVEWDGDPVDGAINCLNNSTLIVNGNVNAISANTSYSKGVMVTSGSTATINGNISCSGIVNVCGVAANLNSTVTINGNITATKSGGGYEIGAAVYSGATVTINGTITATTYCQIEGANKTETDNTLPTTKPNYNTYKDGVSAVWVRSSPICQIGATTYETLDAALAAIPAGAATQTVIKLLDNIYYPNKTCTISNKKITFDLNGKDLIFNNSAGTALVVNTNSVVDYIGTGNFKAIGTGDNTTIARYGINADASSCILTYAEVSSKNNATASNAVRSVNGASVTVNGNIRGSGIYYVYGVNATTNSGGNIGGTITVNGDIIINAGDNSMGVSSSSGSMVTINGNVRATNSIGVRIPPPVVNSGAATATVNGTITAKTYIRLGGTNVDDKSEADFVLPTTKDGYFTYSNTNGTVWVLDPNAVFVCEIGDKGYYSLESALSAVPAGGASPTAIKLLQNIAKTDGCTIDNKKITFDLNGYDLIFSSSTGSGLVVNNGAAVDYTGAGNFKAITTRSGVTASAVTVSGASSCTLTRAEGLAAYTNAVSCSGNNSSLTVNGDVYSSGSEYCYGVSASYNAAVTVNGNILCDGNGVYGVSGYNEATVTVNGNITVPQGVGARAFTNSDLDGGKITVNGAITAKLYIQVASTAKNQADSISPTTKTGYFTYADGTSTVWVKIPPQVTAVTISPNPASVQTGKTQLFTASVTVIAGAAESVTWSVSGQTSALTGISASGLLTVGNNETTASIKVKAVSDFNNAVFDEATVSVIFIPQVTAVVISPNPPTSVQTGQTLQFTAAVTAVHGASESVTWSISGQTSALTGISASGLLAVDANETATSIKVKAVSNFDNTIFDELTVTIIIIPQVTAIKISPASPSVQPGKTQQFTAAVTAVHGAAESVAWSVSGQTSMLTNISASGLLTVGNNETAASIKVKAVSDFNNAVFDEATISVTSTTGISEMTDYGLRIYPNPTKGELKIENGELKIKNVEIVDISGKIIINYQLSTVNSIDISHLPPGIYFVKMTTENGVVTQKIVKSNH